jgi:hypothetical protein
MRAILENGTSPIIKEFSSWEAFPSRILYTSISVQLFTTTKLSGYKRTLQHH